MSAEEQLSTALAQIKMMELMGKLQMKKILEDEVEIKNMSEIIASFELEQKTRESEPEEVETRASLPVLADKSPTCTQLSVLN